MVNVLNRAGSRLYKNGLLAAMALGSMIAASGIANHASADPVDSGTVAMNGNEGTVTFSSGESEPVIDLSLSGQAVYCINPFVIVHDGALATQAGQDSATNQLWSSMTDYQRSLANNVAYLGNANGASGDKTVYIATQLAMWSVLAGQNGVSGVFSGSNNVDISKMNNVLGGRTVSSINLSNNAAVSAKAAEILNNAAALSKNPEFNGSPIDLTAGHSVTVSDTNGVDLSKYKRITGTNGISAYTNGTSIVVSAPENSTAGQATLTLDTGFNRNRINYIYGTVNPDGTQGQTLYAAGDPSRLNTNLSFNIVKANLKIDKTVLQDNGQTNKYLSNSNYSLEGNEFEIHKDTADGPVVKTVTTNADGYVETGPVMDYGHYVITEKQASKGLYNSFTPIEVDLDSNGQLVKHVEGSNKEVRGETTLTKKDSKTGDSTQGKATFAGAQYGLFYDDGTAVQWHKDGQPDPVLVKGTKVAGDNVVLTLDDNSQVSVKNLPLGNYYWQELKAPEGYAIDKSKHRFSLTYQDQNTAQVESISDSPENVVTFSFDGYKYVLSQSGSSRTGRNGIKLQLVPLDGTKGSIIETTTTQDKDGYDGYYKFENVPYGDYELIEANVPDGFQSITPMYVHIGYNADKTGYVMTMTEKGQAVPMKTVEKSLDEIDNQSENIYLGKTFLNDDSQHNEVTPPTPNPTKEITTIEKTVEKTATPTVQQVVTPTVSPLPQTGVHAPKKPNYLMLMAAIVGGVLVTGSFNRYRVLKLRKQRLEEAETEAA